MMKIIDDILQWWVTHDTSFSQIVIGLLIALVGPFITFYIGRSTDFHCVRIEADQVRCDITRKLLGFQPLDERRVRGIQRAQVDENMDSEGDSTYRVVFVTSNGLVPLTGSYSSGYTPKADLVDRINAFIDSDQPSTLDVQMGIEPWVWVFLFGSIGLGVGMILAALKHFLT